jgi:hypothetical protein
MYACKFWLASADAIAGKPRSHRTSIVCRSELARDDVKSCAGEIAGQHRVSPVFNVVRRTGFSREGVGPSAKSISPDILSSRLKPVLQVRGVGRIYRQEAGSHQVAIEI